MKMKITFALAAAAAALVAAPVAQAASTNAVQHVYVQLLFRTQGPYHTNRLDTNIVEPTIVRTPVDTHTIIGWLGQATTNNFSSKAHLVRVRTVDGTNDTVTFEVRDGDNPPVDVGAYLTCAFSDNIVSAHHTDIVGVSDGRDFAQMNLILTNTPVSFNLTGIGEINYVGVRAGEVVVVADELDNDDLSGTGLLDTNGPTSLVAGGVSFYGTVSEIK